MSAHHAPSTHSHVLAIGGLAGALFLLAPMAEAARVPFKYGVDPNAAQRSRARGLSGYDMRHGSTSGFHWYGMALNHQNIARSRGLVGYGMHRGSNLSERTDWDRIRPSRARQSTALGIRPSGERRQMLIQRTTQPIRPSTVRFAPQPRLGGLGHKIAGVGNGSGFRWKALSPIGGRPEPIFSGLREGGGSFSFGLAR